ncbi:universal stress protein UspA and related nucleotide-binding proteins [Candidatus Scalindua japonica]|uniref:Universal stress protein UspA and related nucleotide-binding proteins n=1 Tax=Candidatus Scalindua japonica TaxID=1284222 RepID=A0A286TVF5_9BACT|nr:universal stress protein [Candidatus Scalindua japonica]GAX59821.1 universal stress protein UspA and related nucleotide-binding proteins [Candidatus Scalindua japonica]
MFNTILVPIDSSDTSLVAVDYAIDLARSFKSEIAGISIIDIKKLAGPFMRDLGTSIGGMVPYGDFQQQVRQFLEDTATAALDELEGKCNTAGISFTRTKKEGVVAREIVESAKRCDMIAMGMAGEHVFWRDAFLGSNLESVVRQTHKPVLVTPEKYKKITKVLVAYDASTFATKALIAGVDIARQMKLPLTVVTVSDDEKSGEEVLSQVDEKLKESDITYDKVLKSGETVNMILDLCDQGSYDLLVMGAYGHSKIRELIIGSTTLQIMRKVNCAVLLCR